MVYADVQMSFGTRAPRARRYQMTEMLDESGIITSRSGAGLMKFFDVKVRRHELPDSVASPLRTASKRVLDVEENPDAVDLATINTDRLVARFRIKNCAALTDQSLQAYETRFRRALTMYFRWLDNDPDWVGKVHQSSGANGASKTGKVTRTAVTGRYVGGKNARPAAGEQPPVDSAQDDIVVDEATAADGPPHPELFDYQVALVDSNVIAILRLPRTYTPGDAARMAALINALAVPNAPSPSSSDA